ncbi:helix-turn-helix transcriptional regulator [Virgibacillus pantothenticus]|uniref:helix-turn-helix domain-containing protein n=1 Tax=Virgibacillus pantothenticus TaxID=1473 RepID=UPI001C224CAC|nr:helix-turn-helix transcriptional regulator [Virgibacillus pantothenticus]MBU8567601.1 helix-turn-helix transcriptional regulator [Virgibacillus pantothenticus]MBU8601389.1 helix-turn-helix transcriptional regulator [Virgibacillus pantothenticus]MBU8636206.1 helix-turn-helix transcriptional regulator [Virgibacillus pantothenticus]MBU8643726.1 helix-turn-helix transcriptional regulator [Virgibacillus pantothenticus]MBU8648018.1 helix-turn-helix transcriptional regulator [Virgibacillus pantoth
MEKDIGKFIAEHRKESGFKSQRQLAEKSGISAATISRIESNTQRPNPETLKTLSRYLKTTSYQELMIIAGYWEENDGTNKEISDIYENEHTKEEKIINIIKNIVDDEGKFPAEYHQDIFKIFGGYAEDDYLHERSSFKSRSEFDEWYMDFYLIQDDLSENDIEECIEEFNKFYNYKTVKHGILNLDKNFICLNKTLEDFLLELEEFINKHDLKILLSDQSHEKEFLDKLELSDEKLLEEFNLVLDGKKLTEDEAKGIIAYLRSLRQFDK